MYIGAWIVFGVMIGVISYALDPDSSPQGLRSAVMLGIAGALVGGFSALFLFGGDAQPLPLTSFLVAVIGAGGVLAVYKLYGDLKDKYTH